MTIDKLLRAQVALVAFIAAYLAEVVRGGLQAIPRGQYEAAASLGLSEKDEQRQHGESSDHEQLIVVDVGDDFRLPGNDGIQRGASGGGVRAPKM